MIVLSRMIGVLNIYHKLSKIMTNTDMILPLFKTYCNSEFPSDPKINITKIGALAKLMS